jgi:hypothetical protein
MTNNIKIKQIERKRFESDFLMISSCNFLLLIQKMRHKYPHPNFIIFHQHYSDIGDF